MLSLKMLLFPLKRRMPSEQEWPLVRESVREALRALDEMRIVEGAALWRDIERG